MNAYDLARQDIGVWEWKDGHNPKVVQYFADVGHSWVKDDETAWCAAFVGAMLERAGQVSTRALNARSYLEYSEPVDLDNAQPGDIVVFTRGNPNGWQGHVAFYVKHDNEKIWVLGGNQQNQVNVRPYSKNRLLGVRVLPGREQVEVSSTPPTGNFITALLEALSALFGGKEK